MKATRLPDSENDWKPTRKKGEDKKDWQKRYFTAQREDLEKKAMLNDGADRAGGPRTLKGAKDRNESENVLRHIYSKLSPEQKKKTQAGKMDKSDNMMSGALQTAAAFLPFGIGKGARAAEAGNMLAGGARKALGDGLKKGAAAKPTSITSVAQKALGKGKESRGIRVGEGSKVPDFKGSGKMIRDAKQGPPKALNSPPKERKGDFYRDLNPADRKVYDGTMKNVHGENWPAKKKLTLGASASGKAPATTRRATDNASYKSAKRKVTEKT